ncbi:MAG: response regulator transcription factor [Thermoanaerobaculia bacterium]
MNRILVVDDEPAVVDVVAFALRKAGFVVQVAGTLAGARRLLDARLVDFLVLDLGLPDGDGMEFCRQVRAASAIPVLVLTCRDDEVDRVLGLESGADDYVVKPFSPRELVARVRAILRRTVHPEPAKGAPAVMHGAVRVDPGSHLATWREIAVPLTRIEFDLLYLLFKVPNRVFSREELVDRVYRGEALVSDRTIDSHVKGVRRKFQLLGASADPIETVFGVGYRARGIE